jgi:hypothetical protein
MDRKKRSLDEDVKYAKGNWGFSFGEEYPDGVTIVNPLPAGMVFHNGAKAALRMTLDVTNNDAKRSLKNRN